MTKIAGFDFEVTGGEEKDFSRAVETGWCDAGGMMEEKKFNYNVRIFMRSPHSETFLLDKEEFFGKIVHLLKQAEPGIFASHAGGAVATLGGQILENSNCINIARCQSRKDTLEIREKIEAALADIETRCPDMQALNQVAATMPVRRARG